MSKFKSLISSITEAIGLAPPKAPFIPLPEIPSAPAQAAAPTRQTTGANVVVGADAVRNQRVSGSRGSGSRLRSRDVIGGLGAGGGLRI